MRKIIAFFIKNPLAGNLLMVMILVFGIFGMTRMKSTFFPEAPEKIILIEAILPGASPEEIEQGIVLKIEENLKAVTGVERISSISSENAARVEVEIKDRFQIDLVKQDVENVVNTISSFPTDMEALRVYKQENRNFAFSFALNGDVPLKILKEESRKIEDKLRASGIISKISLSGFPNEEIEIGFRELDLIKHQISFSEAVAAVRSSNIEITGGKVKGTEEELLVRTKNKGYFADDLKQIIVKTTPEGSPLYLHQIADIKDQWQDNPLRSYINYKPSVVVTILNTDEEDLLTIATYMQKFVADYNQDSKEIKATVIRDGSVTLRQRIDLLVENGVIGFFLVLICLGLFLHWSIAFWVASSIPIAFAGMFIFGFIGDWTINVVSLFGMILVVGILVDDGIVISENIYTLRQKGYSRYDAAVEGTLSVLPSVVSAVLTTVVAFSLFFFVEGRIGDIFKDLAAVVIVTLLISLVEGMLILPEHLYHSTALADEKKEKSRLQKFMDQLIGYMDKLLMWFRDRVYAPVLNISLQGWQRLFPFSIMIGALIICFASISGGFVKTTFFPFIERDNVEINLLMPAGTREQITLDLLTEMEKKAWEVNQHYKSLRKDGKDIIEKIEKNIGPNSYNGKLSITLMDGENRMTPVLEIQDSIRKKVGAVPAAESLTFGIASIFGKPISISVLGNNLNELNQAVEEVKKELNEIKDLKDVIDNNQAGLREINLSLNQRGKQLGLNLQEVVAQVRQGFFGAEVQRLQRGRDEVRIWVRYIVADRSSSSKLEQMRLRFVDGREFPLIEIADFNITRGVVNINHLDGKREVKVEADIANKKVSVTDITAKLKNEIIPQIEKKYASVQFRFEGQNKENEKSMKSIQTAAPIILLVMFLLIVFTFGSIGQATVVMLTIPFGFIGVVWGHYALDAPISFFSILGIIALIGIMVNDSLVLVAAYNENIAAGMKTVDAVREAGISRFRAILLTSLTTILGLGPLILEKSVQAQFLIPMAISVAFGLFVATVITLFLLPAFVLIHNRYKWLIASAWEGRWLLHEEVESAYPNRKNYFILWMIPFLPIVLLFILSIIF